MLLCWLLRACLDKQTRQQHLLCYPLRCLLAVVVRSDLLLFRWRSLQPAVDMWRRVNLLSVDVTRQGMEGSLRQLCLALIRAAVDMDCHCWGVTRYRLKSERRINSPWPVNARSASTYCASTSVRSLSMRSGIFCGRHWTADFRTWLRLSQPLFIHDEQPTVRLSRSDGSMLKNTYVYQ